MTGNKCKNPNKKPLYPDKNILQKIILHVKKSTLEILPYKCKHLKPIPKPIFHFFPPTTFPPLDPLLYVLQRILQDFKSPSIYPPKRFFKNMYLSISRFYSQPFHPHLIYCLVACSNGY